jgi:hypothetical protein
MVNMPRISFRGCVAVGFNALIQMRTRKNRKTAVQKWRNILFERDLVLRSERLRSRVLVAIGLDGGRSCSADPQFAQRLPNNRDRTLHRERRHDGRDDNIRPPRSGSDL